MQNPSQDDLDANGVGDACEDSDGDGVFDFEDNCPQTTNPSQIDTDGDGIGDEDGAGDEVAEGRRRELSWSVPSLCCASSVMSSSTISEASGRVLKSAAQQRVKI